MLGPNSLYKFYAPFSMNPHHSCVADDVGQPRRVITDIASGAAEAAPITPAEARSAIERIRKSRTVSESGRLIEFLSFVVELMLNGDAGQLKETTIAVSVFGRRPDYDPKADAIVRRQAWRLRSKLAEYYRQEGSHDPLIIDLQPGGYVPTIRRRSSVTDAVDGQLQRFQTS